MPNLLATLAKTHDKWGQACFVDPQLPTTIFDEACPHLSREGLAPSSSPVACLWVGNSIDQVRGDRHAHIFLLYVVSEHRRRGIGKALMQYVENWALTRGDRQIGLQVFKSNQPALNLYNQLGYQTQSLWMVKSLDYKKI
uniref:GNAT family N-acetyltransferase n=1 Tax=Hassallia byssoidea TaxID=482630 RepID=UPI003013439B